MVPDHEPGRRPPQPPAERLGEEVEKKARRRLKAREERHRSVWFGLGMFGLVGWSVALPTVVGVAIGLWLDSIVESRRSWTLVGLFAGVAVGCLNAWYWVKKESRHE